MKKSTLISAALLLSMAGCNTCGNSNSGRPGFFTSLTNRLHGQSNTGAPCDAGCEAGAPAAMGAPMANAGCSNCGENVGYGGYDTVIGSDEGMSLGTSYSTVPMTQGTTMGTPTTTYPLGTTRGGERVSPKLAN